MIIVIIWLITSSPGRILSLHLHLRRSLDVSHTVLTIRMLITPIVVWRIRVVSCHLRIKGVVMMLRLYVLLRGLRNEVAGLRRVVTLCWESGLLVLLMVVDHAVKTYEILCRFILRWSTTRLGKVRKLLLLMSYSIIWIASYYWCRHISWPDVCYLFRWFKIKLQKTYFLFYWCTFGLRNRCRLSLRLSRYGLDTLRRLWFWNLQSPTLVCLQRVRLRRIKHESLLYVLLEHVSINVL